VILLATMMLPAQITMIPHYQIFRYSVGLTRCAVIVRVSSGRRVLHFPDAPVFKTIPVELEEAARLDGCSNLRVFWDIMLPLSTPALATIAVMSFITHCRFHGPLIYLNSFEKYTVSIVCDVPEHLRQLPSLHAGRVEHRVDPRVDAVLHRAEIFRPGDWLTGIKG